MVCPDSVQNVSHVAEGHLQAAAGRRRHEPAGRVGDGVPAEPGLHGENPTGRKVLQPFKLHLET